MSKTAGRPGPDPHERQFAHEVREVVAELKLADEAREQQEFRDAYARMEPWAYRSGS